MPKDFAQNDWSPLLEMELKKLLELAVWEDTETSGDLTSKTLIAKTVPCSATVVTRENGILAGSQAVPTVLAAVDRTLSWVPHCTDGDPLQPGTAVGDIRGPVHSLLTAERLVLNLLGRLCGIATLTRRFVDAVDGTGAKIYDTRKTTLGWRRLEKYAVRCGGGNNHRIGLFDAVLIKDNHLAFGQESGGFAPVEAVRKAKDYFDHRIKLAIGTANTVLDPNQQDISEESPPIIEIEVDTVDQLRSVLPASPDIVLLDNMDAPTLRQAVEIRNAINRNVELEASGGINLSTVRDIAESGVERISVGAMTHSAIVLDLGLDWK